MIVLDEKQLPPQGPPPYSLEAEQHGEPSYPPPVAQASQLLSPGSSTPRSPAGPAQLGAPARSLNGYPSSVHSAAYSNGYAVGSAEVPASREEMDARLGSRYQQQLYARCARGDHEPSTKYGPCGIITAIILFPFGLVALLLDKETKCARCGERIS